MSLKKICFLTLLTYVGTEVDAVCQRYSHGKCYSTSSHYTKPSCVSFVDNFSRNDVVEISQYNGNPNGDYRWVSEFLPNHAAVENGELILSMPLGTRKNSYGRLQGFGATVTSIRWLHYGNATARVKTASTSPGVVTSFIIRNPEGDEIDFEWVGGSPDEVQTNYYYNGILDYKNGVKTSIGSNTADGFNEYMFQWEKEFIKFYVNSKVIRTIYKKDTWDEKMKVYKYPARPAQVHFGIWDGGRGAPGTTEWAGGPTNWSNPKTVYKAYFNYVDIQCQHNHDKAKSLPTSTKRIIHSSSTLLITETSTSASTSTPFLTSSTNSIPSLTSSSMSTLTLTPSTFSTLSSTSSAISTSSLVLSTSTPSTSLEPASIDSKAALDTKRVIIGSEPTHIPDIETQVNSAAAVKFGSVLLGVVTLITTYISQFP